MEELKRLLGQTDDEYLTGLCNKGTVKRAYKDLEQEAPTVIWTEDGAQVTLKETVCGIRVPLGESTCSCPSRSICRHLITAILYLKKELVKDEPESGTDASMAPDMQTEVQKDEDHMVQELLAVPLKKLKGACKTRKYREFLNHIEAGDFPEIREGTVITVRIPWENSTVKLLNPLEYSSCTCHSKELCTHKAQAILAFQLKKKATTLEELKRLSESEEEWDFQELAQVADTIKEGIRLHLMTGLSRLSPEAAGSMERLAVISHGAGLADFETRCRDVAGEYQNYFERSAAFRTEVITGKLLGLYHMANKLEMAKKTEEVRKLAGTFRDTYYPVSQLHLTAIGGRSFRNNAGYEGEIYYFLETDQKKWYTWTDARPTFYEGMRRRPPGRDNKVQAPWGLNCSREKMMELEFYLSHGKVAGGSRLSVSQETKSEIVGIRDLHQNEIRQMIFWDYREILRTCFQENHQEKDRERLAFVGAVQCREGTFDSVKQRFTMELCDREGCCLSVAVKYSKEEKLTIQVLERLSERLKKRGMVPLVFFGILYVEQGKLCLYPIEFFEGQRFLEEMEEMEEGPFGTPQISMLNQEQLRSMEQFLREIRETLSDLFQSGLNSVREETLANLGHLAKESEELGLHRAGEELSFLNKSLGEKRHQMEFDPEPVLTSWIRLTTYLDICMDKVSLDQVLAGMMEGKERG